MLVLDDVFVLVLVEVSGLVIDDVFLLLLDYVSACTC